MVGIKENMKKIITSLTSNYTHEIKAMTQASQKMLMMHYKDLVNQRKPLPQISETGFQVYSQNDEDGILLFIFSVIGTTNKIFIEIGTGVNGHEKMYRKWS